jgi:hypothetical protein
VDNRGAATLLGWSSMTTLPVPPPGVEAPPGYEVKPR